MEEVTPPKRQQRIGSKLKPVKDRGLLWAVYFDDKEKLGLWIDFLDELAEQHPELNQADLLYRFVYNYIRYQK